MPSNSTKLEESNNECMGCEADPNDKEEVAEIIKADTGGGESKLAIIQSMIKQLRNGTPIYRVQLPIFLQEPRSLLERYSDFCSHMDFFTRYVTFGTASTIKEQIIDVQCSVADIEDPELRFLAVVKFYLAGWHSRPNVCFLTASLLFLPALPSLQELRNPFNPVLGEIFKSRYEHSDSTTHYIAEQISHHPPSSAFSIINDAKGMYLSAYIRPSFRFKGNSLDTALQGRLAGHCRRFKEDYEITFPHFVVRGLLFGGLNLSLCGTAKLACPQSGYSAELDFKSKGFFSGKPNYVVVTVKHQKQKKPLFTVEGRWDEVLTITNNNSGQSNIFFDCRSSPTTNATVAPVNEQGEYESRRVWHKVVQNIAQNNETEALKEKTIVEEHQRVLERERKAKDMQWTPKLFVKVKEDFYVHKSLIQISPIFRS